MHQEANFVSAAVHQYLCFMFPASDYNECEQTRMCHHGKCLNMEGTYRCVCIPGYRLSNDQTACIGQ